MPRFASEPPHCCAKVLANCGRRLLVASLASLLAQPGEESKALSRGDFPKGDARRQGCPVFHDAQGQWVRISLLTSGQLSMPSFVPGIT